MIKTILRTFLLMTFTVGFLRVSHAQQSPTSMTGEWFGNSELSGRSEFMRFSITDNAGEMLRPLKAKLSLVQPEGSHVRWIRPDAGITRLRFTQTEVTT